MPRRDGNGPAGMGSMTGRGLGYCRTIKQENTNAVGFFKNCLGLGMGYGRRNGGRAWNASLIAKEDLQRRAQQLQSELDLINQTLSGKTDEQ